MHATRMNTDKNEFEKENKRDQKLFIDGIRDIICHN